MAGCDPGTRINPMFIEGQIHGVLTEAFAVGMGQQIPFDECGNHLGNSLMDYVLPVALETPHWETDRTVAPCPTPPVRHKRCGHRRVWAGRGQVAAGRCLPVEHLVSAIRLAARAA